MPVIQEQTTKSDINVNQTSAQKTEELTRNLCSASAKITARPSEPGSFAHFFGIYHETGWFNQ